MRVIDLRVMHTIRSDSNCFFNAFDRFVDSEYSISDFVASKQSMRHCVSRFLRKKSMRQYPIQLDAVRAVRQVRSGVELNSISENLKIDVRAIEKFGLAFADVNDDVLTVIERLLIEREKLRKVVASLMQEGGFIPK